MKNSIASLYPSMMLATMGIFDTGDTRNKFQKTIEEGYNLEAVIDEYCQIKLHKLTQIKSKYSRKQREQIVNTVDNLISLKKLLPHHINTRMYNAVLIVKGENTMYRIDEFTSIEHAESEMMEVCGEFYIK